MKVLSSLRNTSQAGGNEIMGLEVELQDRMPRNFCLIISTGFCHVVMV